MRLAVITDIHEDIVSLEKAITKINALNCTSIVCLGDVIGFSVPWYLHQKTRNAGACLEIIKSCCDLTVIGNHDLFGIRKIPEFNYKFIYPKMWYQLDYPTRLKLGRDKVWLHEEDELDPLLGESEKEFLMSLKEYACVTATNGLTLYSHYLFPNFSGSEIIGKNFNAVLNDHLQFMDSGGINLSFVGHSHGHYCTIHAGSQKTVLRYGEQFEIKGLTRIVCFCPPIVQRKVESGFLIYDTQYNLLELVELK